MANSLKVGVGWSSQFKRSGLASLRYRSLRDIYHAPALFAQTMLADGSEISFIRFNDELRAGDLDGTSSQIAESVHLFYCASHGEYRSPAYSLQLHVGEWKPCNTGLGLSQLAVVIFDTCDLMDLADPAWSGSWIASVGPHLRLLLGFASPATVALDSTLRGRAFAEEIVKGKPLGPSWLHAVHATSYLGADLAVAVGLGENPADADWALHNMTLADIPRPRSSATAFFLTKVCH